jgi:hypothetical protein
MWSQGVKAVDPSEMRQLLILQICVRLEREDRPCAMAAHHFEPVRIARQEERGAPS